MRIVVEVISGPDQGKRIRLHDGLVARFGQTEWADFSFPDDSAMAEFHFMLDCRQGQCVLHGLQAAETFVNGSAATRQPLASGDRIAAGQTEFLLHLDGAVAAAESATPRPPKDAVAAQAAAMTPREICHRLQLAAAAPELAGEADSAPAFTDALGQQGDYLQAFYVRGFTLGRRLAVAWGCHLVRQSVGERLHAAQTGALQAAADWVQSPDQDRCRQAEAAAIQAEHSGPGGWLAAAAFWSGDNIAPASSPQPVPPDDTLASRAVAAALTLALHQLEQPPIEERFAQFIDCAQRIESGELVLFDC